MHPDHQHSLDTHMKSAEFSLYFVLCMFYKQGYISDFIFHGRLIIITYSCMWKNHVYAWPEACAAHSSLINIALRVGNGLSMVSVCAYIVHT